MDTPVSTTGLWEEGIMSNLLILSNALSRGVSQTVSWLLDHSGEVIMLIGLILVLCGIALGIRYLWRRWLKTSSSWLFGKVRWLYHRLVRNPAQWLTRPVRKLHRRWSERNLRAKMAKFEERIIADKILDVLYDEVEQGRISKGRFRRLQTEMGNFFNIPDLVRRKTHKEAIKRKLKANKESKIGPKGTIPGGKPGDNIVPIYKGLGHGYLSRKKSA